MKKTNYKLGVLALFCLIMYAQCAETVVTKDSPIVAIPVEYAVVSQNDIKEYITFNGVTQYSKKENIRSHITGYISSMNFILGQYISKNQTFALVRTKEQDALGDLSNIDASLIQISQPITIKSNENGIITSLNITNNDYVAEGDILAIITQPKSLVVQLNTPYEFHDFIRIGSVCKIILPNGKEIMAKISGELPVIDPISQSQAFIIPLPKENLPENLNVSIRIISKENRKAISVPRKAIQTDELLTEFWVMRLEGDSLAIKTPVEVLIQNDSLVEIKSDLIAINDKVITKGSYQLQDSAFVKIK